MKNKRGFTLVELLAVLVILGIILLIAVPSYINYIKSSRIKLYNSYERTLADTAQTYLTNCLLKNKCEDSNLTYDDILGTRKLNISKLNVKTEKCDNAEGYVAIIEDDSFDDSNSATEIDKYKYVTCLKCGDEYQSDSCGEVINEVESNDIIEQEKIEFVDSESFNENINCTNIYTNQSSYTYTVKYDDVKVDIGGNLKSNFCSNNKCVFNETDYGKKIKIIDFVQGTACFNITKDTQKPTVSKTFTYSTKKLNNQSVSSENFDSVWATSKKVKLSFNDNLIEKGLYFYKGKCNNASLQLLSKNEITIDSSAGINQSICISDIAGNIHQEDITFKNITNVYPTLELVEESTTYDYHATYNAKLKLFSGISGMGIDDENIEWFLTQESTPQSVNNSTKGIKKISGDSIYITIGNNLVGEYYLFVKEITNSIHNTSYSSDTVEINGTKYRRFGKFKFYNNNLDEFFTININYPISKDENGKVPYAELQVTTTDKISNYPSQLKSKGFTYSWGSEKLIVNEAKTYSVTIIDSLGNSTTKQFNCSNIINADAYTFVFNYNGYTPGTWTKNNVSINIAPKLKGKIALNYYKRASFAGNALKEASSLPIDFSETITANTSVNSSFNVEGNVVIGGKTILMNSTSGTIKIDKTKPSITNIYISSFTGNKSNSKKEVLTSDSTYTIKYHDPNDNFWLTKNTSPVTLKLGITVSDTFSGIDSGGKYIKYNRTNEYITKSEFDTRIQNIVNTIDNGEDNTESIYINVIDRAGNLSNEVEIKLFRKTNNTTGW